MLFVKKWEQEKFSQSIAFENMHTSIKNVILNVFENLAYVEKATLKLTIEMIFNFISLLLHL